MSVCSENSRGKRPSAADALGVEQGKGMTTKRASDRVLFQFDEKSMIMGQTEFCRGTGEKNMRGQMRTILFPGIAVLSCIVLCSPAKLYGGEPVRIVKGGSLSGFNWDSSTMAWLGIPYAKPPVGTLRWKAPKDPEPFEGIYEATDFSSECTQYGGLLLDLKAETFGEAMGSEDCLSLNIWRPDTPEDNLPVFVWVHGGMNSVGEGATSLYHGANLARFANAVVVTINYRIGLLGWFAHKALRTGNPEDDSGNYGLLDIIHALKWVNRNIASFGGDPNMVTLAGESGGGFNVISLLVSPLAKGLFHRAIAMSPSTSMTAMTTEEAHKKANQILIRILIEEGLAKSEEDAKNQIDEKGPIWVRNHLLSLSPEAILAHSDRISDLGLNEIGLTTDVLGSSRFEDGVVITAKYREALKKGEVNRVPLMIGSNAEEVKIFELAFGIITSLDETELLDLVLEFDPETSDWRATDFVPWLLLPEYETIGRSAGNVLFQKTGVDPLAKVWADYADVYVYKFAWNDQPEPFDILVGASHMMELPFVFANFQTDSNSLFRFAWSGENREGVIELSNAIIGYISNFIRTGDPNHGPANVHEWHPWKNNIFQQKRLYWDNSISMGR
ncbi:MAG: carboxylesterase family protein [Myxococcota bacterium]|jgi:para-nitrobenzyl esterase|nr:carboxylesterase family protein [Myxococcota bacterium]